MALGQAVERVERGAVQQAERAGVLLDGEVRHAAEEEVEQVHADAAQPGFLA